MKLCLHDVTFPALASPCIDVVFEHTQVTADGIPVIWHDDLVLSLPQQPDSLPQMHKICELNLRDFKKLSQRSSSSSDSSSSSSRDSAASSSVHNNKSTDRTAPGPKPDNSASCSSDSAMLTEAAAAQAPYAQHGVARLARFFNSAEGKRMHSAQAWSVSEEDALPTLAEVFKVSTSPWPTSCSPAASGRQRARQ